MERKYYRRTNDQMDKSEVSSLEKSLYPEMKWLAKFVHRVRNVACEKEVSQIQICEKYNISKSRLSASINKVNPQIPSSDVVRAFAQELNISADYLLGLRDCIDPANVRVSKELGLTDASIDLLKLKKQVSELPKLIPSSDQEDAFNYPQVIYNGLFSQYEGDGIRLSSKDVIARINEVMKTNPKFFSQSDYLDGSITYEANCESTKDKIEIEVEKLKRFNDLCPCYKYFETLNFLISYKNGILIDLLAEILFKRKYDYEIAIDDCSSNNTYYEPFVRLGDIIDKESDEALSILRLQNALLKAKEYINTRKVL